MNHFSRRIVASGTLALALVPAFGMTAAPAFAGVDLDAVAEGISESGYYVDSHAKYYQSDGAQELLRSAQGRSVAVFIAILPPGDDPGQVLRQLPGLMKRKGTYAVLAGDQLRVTSTALPGTRVKSIYDGAVKGSKGKPDLALLRFVQTLPESKYAPPKTGRPGNNGKPAPETSVQKQQEQEQEERTLAQSQPTGRATGYEAPEDDGSAMPYLLGGGAAVVVVAAGAGFVLWRRRSANPAPAGGTGAPGAAAAPPPGPAAQPPAAQPPVDGPPADGPKPGDSRPEPPQNI